MGQSQTRIGDFKIGKEKLGSGQFGEVYKGTMNATGETIALKKCPVGVHDKLEMAMKEIKALEHIPKHDHIVHILGYTFHENYAFIAMEFCDRGNLESYAEEKGTFTMKEKILIMYQCASGLNKMHTLKTPVAHRDLKPANVLFKTENGQTVAKIGDFGLAKVVDDNTMLKTVMGTMLYMAPEMFKSENYTSSVDVFAMGLMYLALLRYEELGEMIPLPEDRSDVTKAEAYGMKIAAIGGLLGRDVGYQFVEKKSTDSDDVKVVKTVIEAMLVSVPRMRINMSEVKRHLAGLLGLTPEETKTKKDGGDMAALLRRMGLADRSTTPKSRPTSDRKSNPSRDSDSDDDISLGGAAGGLAGLLGMLKELEKGIDRRKAGLTTTSHKFRVGERVCVYPELDHVKKRQEDHGGWKEEMECTLGKAGYIDKRLAEEVYGVRFDDGNRFAYNEEVLHIVVDEEALAWSPHAPLVYLDVIVIEKDLKLLKKYQEELGDWSGKVAMSAGQKGIVHRIKPDGTVIVECHMQETFTFNSKSLTKVDPSTQKFEKGDLVIVKLDRRAVIDALGETPGWAEPMEKCLGESGQVLEMRTDKIVKVNIDDETWKWTTDCLILVGKQAELVKAAMLKKTTTDLVAKLAESMLKK